MGCNPRCLLIEPGRYTFVAAETPSGVRFGPAEAAVGQGYPAAARQLWQDDGWVFSSVVGAPLNPNSDYHRWKALLKEAGVRDGRLHDARHTAATVLLVLGVPERTVMGIMGWSSTAMAARYQHVTDPIRRQVADQVGGLLWADKRPVQDDK